jgi:hypothetical protein
MILRDGEIEKNKKEKNKKRGQILVPPFFI